ncbi:unnamed protein product [Allacma fusca]|uniref:Uncharacterized protein n=1 Tax=Allacma fusca TaxID=39272 RepID=A0A8J2JYA7_9HEXA|nr:unnamed protein product [Allacma fusca]
MGFLRSISDKLYYLHTRDSLINELLKDVSTHGSQSILKGPLLQCRQKWYIFRQNGSVYTDHILEALSRAPAILEPY